MPNSLHRAISHESALATMDERTPILPNPGPIAAALPKETDALASRKRSAFAVGALWGAPAATLLATVPASTFVCVQSAAANVNLPAFCAKSPKWMAALTRTVPNNAAQALGRLWPASLYATWGTQKVADALAVAYYMAFYQIPWENEAQLFARRPDMGWPQQCTRPNLPHCPDVLSWNSADQWVGGVNVTVCLVSATVLGAVLGGLIWRDGVAHLAKLPVSDAGDAHWTFRGLWSGETQSWLGVSKKVGSYVVLKAREEVACRNNMSSAQEP